MSDRTPQRSARSGFTLVETLMALAVSSMVGLAAAMMLAAVGAGTRVHDDTRQASMKRQVAIARLGSVTRGAARVLAAGDDHLVFWIGDANGDEWVNVSEMRRLGWDADAAEVTLYEAPADVDPDTGFDPTDDSVDLNAISASLVDGGELESRTLLRGVTGWAVQLDDPADVQAARIVRLDLTLAAESGDDVATTIATLRAAANTGDDS